MNKKRRRFDQTPTPMITAPSCRSSGRSPRPSRRELFLQQREDPGRSRARPDCSEGHRSDLPTWGSLQEQLPTVSSTPLPPPETSAATARPCSPSCPFGFPSQFTVHILSGFISRNLTLFSKNCIRLHLKIHLIHHFNTLNHSLKIRFHLIGR